MALEITDSNYKEVLAEGKQVVAAIEIVVVKAVERSLVIIIERLVDKVELG